MSEQRPFDQSRLSVGAFLQPEMILERIKKRGDRTDKLVVTGVGDKAFLARDLEGNEERYTQNSADEYYATGMGK